MSPVNETDVEIKPDGKCNIINLSLNSSRDTVFQEAIQAFNQFFNNDFFQFYFKTMASR